jgi:uncharacterized flavoprotein (TIGR03862 family)
MPETVKTPRAIIIGGGPAGLMSAERLAAAGWQVAVHDRMPTLARKFLMAGRGGLNLTHSEPIDRFLTRYRDPSGAIEAAVTAFPPDALRTWAEGLGETTYIGSSGRVFPTAMKASPLLRAWIHRLQGLGVTFHTRSRWVGWDAVGRARFIDAAGVETTAAADVTVLALGGASWPRLGSDGAWVPMLTDAGVTVAPFEASNCGVRIDWSDPFRTRFAGSPLKRIAVSLGTTRVEGEAMITASGLEGGAIYAIGRAIRAALHRQDGPVAITLDLRPGLDETALIAALSQMRKGDSLSNGLRKAGIAPAAIGLLRETLGKTLDPDPIRLAKTIKATPVRIFGTASIDRAISSDGGVSFADIDADLMLRGRPGVFLAGEMLDWDAPTGGYLLQATFATAIQAAEGAIRWYGRSDQGS